MKRVRLGLVVMGITTMGYTVVAQSVSTEENKKKSDVKPGLRVDVMDMNAVLPGIDCKMGKHSVSAGMVTLPFDKYVVNRLTGFYTGYQFYFMEKNHFRQYGFASFMFSDYDVKLDYWQYNPDLIPNQANPGEMPVRAVQTSFIQKLNGTIGYGCEFGFGNHFYLNASIGAGVTSRKETVHSELLEPATFEAPADRYRSGTRMEGQLKLGVGWRM